MTIDPRTPILVGGAQFTQRTAREGRPRESRPIEMLEEISRRAIADTDGKPRRGDRHGFRRALHRGLRRAIRAACPSACSAIRRTSGEPPGCQAAPRVLHRDRGQHTAMAGQSYRRRNRERRMRGRAARRRRIHRLAARRDEARRRSRLGNGADADPGDDPTEIGDMRPGTSDYERRHGLAFPVNVYPLFENGLRGEKHARRPSISNGWANSSRLSPRWRRRIRTPGFRPIARRKRFRRRPRRIASSVSPTRNI